MNKPTSPDQKTITVGTRSSDALWGGLIASAKAPDVPQGEGWRSLVEIAKELGVCRQTATYHVEKWVRDGRAEVAMAGPKRSVYVRPLK